MSIHALEPTDPRTPPHDLGAEESLLGAMLLNRDAVDIGLEMCGPDDFYKPAHGYVFAAMARCQTEGRAVDHVTVTDSLRRAGDLERAGGEAALVALQAFTGSSTRAEHYARIVAEHHLLRRLAGAGYEISELAFDKPLAELPETLDQAEALLSEVVDRRRTRQAVDLGPSMAGWLADITAARESGVAPGIPTGLADIDALLGGLRPGQLLTVAGRPGMGKTAFAAALSLNVASAGFPVQFVSLEMTVRDLQDRFMAITSGIDLARIREPHKLSPRDSELLEAAAPKLDLPVTLEDDPASTLMSIRSSARRLMRGQLGLIIVDYLQLMTSTGKAENRQVEVAEMSRGLKKTALELGVPIVALAQLNRQVEARSDKRPMLADLRESGAIENDSDIVAFLYRDEMYRDTTDDNKGLMEVIIAKHRNGPTKTVKVFYAPDTGQIKNAGVRM